MSYITFQYGAETLVLHSPERPSRRVDEILQVADRTDAGTLQVETLGLNLSQRTFNFSNMPKVEYIDLRNWFYNIVAGMDKWFTCIDEFGFTGTVKFTESKLVGDSVDYKKYAVNFALEYQTAPLEI